VSADRTVAVWVTVSAAGTRVETRTAGGRVHVDVLAPVGELYPEGECDLYPEGECDDYNPVCDCPRVPSDWCQQCGGCAGCGECTHRPRRVSRSL
jgi:hypothetical protein